MEIEFIQDKTQHQSWNGNEQGESPEDYGFSSVSKPAEDKNEWLKRLTNCSDALEKPPPRRKELITGILRDGDKLMLAAPSKAAKTFSLMRLAIAVASNGTWMGSRCRKGKVLYANFELHEDSFKHRLHYIAKALGPQYTTDIEALHLRGQVDCNAEGTSKRISQIAEKIGADLVIIDPVYKIGAGHEENSNSEVTQLLNQLETITNTGACLAFAHHFSKGQQGGKKAIDRASGAGAWARDADAIVTLSDIENKEDLYKVDFILRDFPRRATEGIKWEYPIHTMVELDANDKVAGSAGRKKEYSSSDLLSVLREFGPMRSSDWEQRCLEKHGIPHASFHRLRRDLVDDNEVEKVSGHYQVSK